MQFTKETPTISGIYMWRRNAVAPQWIYSIDLDAGVATLLFGRALGKKRAMAHPTIDEMAIENGEWMGPGQFTSGFDAA
jgi:hypothetical protein